MNERITYHSDKIIQVIKLCNQKIQDQKDHESKTGYGEDYTDGRIVGAAALARRILDILKEIPL
jgi:hypothetical protein